MSRAGRLASVALAAGIALVIAATVLLTGGGDSPADRLDAFIDAWSAGDDRAAADLTHDPEAAFEGLEANRAGLDGATLAADRIDDPVEFGPGEAEAAVALEWDVPEIGAWGYETRAVLVEGPDGEWLIEWRPDLVHPRLAGPHARLGTVREPQPRGTILDRSGRALVEDRPVKRVGVIAGEVENPRASAASLGTALGLDPEPLARSIAAGGPEQFVEAIVLRPADYREVEEAVLAVPSSVTIDDTVPLAPTREFARALLGEVRELTAEQLDELGPNYAVGDVGGQWGLQAVFEPRLAGTPRRAVVIRTQGIPTEELYAVEGTPARDLETTLDLDVQSAAEEALGSTVPVSTPDESGAEAGGLERAGALVATEPSTGEVLAVANRPTDDAFNRALEGRYPPGSTFKIVTAAALIERGGVTPADSVDCPVTVNVGGRLFRNFEGGGGTGMPFSQAFAESCNTAFIGLAAQGLAPRDLPAAASDFGLGAELDLPLPAFGGEVPPPDGDVALAAASIGQDRILASPLAMAGVIATVAAGSWHPPRLLAGESASASQEDPPRPARGLSDRLAADLRAMTRQVVTAGTGTALAGVPGEVHGKSGTAEYGGGDPPATHAWFLAYRDDLAVAVLVEDGAAGGEVAAPIAADFFEALDAS